MEEEEKERQGAKVEKEDVKWKGRKGEKSRREGRGIEKMMEEEEEGKQEWK